MRNHRYEKCKHTTADFAHVGEVWKGVLVAQGHKYHAVVDEGGHGTDDGGLLSSTWGACRYKDAGQFTGQSTLDPQSTGCVPKGLWDDERL